MRLLLIGLEQGLDVQDLAFSIEPLHPRDNTFPGEVFMDVAVHALDLAHAEQRALPYDELVSSHLTECEFRGRRAQKIKFAILAIGAVRGGIDPDLLDEVIWWRTDDFWFYALAGSVAVARACADKRSLPMAEFVGELAHGLDVDLTAVTQ